MRGDNTGIAVAFFWGFIFESVSAPVAGFYLAPVFLGALVFHFLPFTFSLLNAFLAWFSAFLLVLVWGWYMGGFFPHEGLIWHLGLFTFFAVSFLYAFSPKKK